MSIIQRTGYNKNRRVKIDYQGSKKKNLTQEKMEMQTHIISYIKSGTSNNKQIYWFESNIAGRIYILADKGVPSGKRGITTLRIFLTIYDPLYRFFS